MINMEQLYRRLPLLVALTVVLLLSEHLSQSTPQTFIGRRQAKVENKRTEGLNQALQGAYLDLHRPPFESQSHFSALIPPVPNANETECYVEVILYHRYGGRCTQLGGNGTFFICQSGPYFEFQDSCASVLERQSVPQD